MSARSGGGKAKGATRRATRTPRSAAKPRQWRTVDGNVLDEAGATRLAKEFEASDSAVSRRNVEYPKRVGRPSISGADGISPRVSFRLPSEVRERAEEVAAQRGMTVSGLARQALEEFLRRAG